VKLIDSSCWVDYYRPDGDSRIQAAVAEAIESDEAATCGMIRIEILGYIARQALTHREFDTAVAIRHALRAKGASVPATDLLIAAAAMNNNATLLHCDRHFLTIGRYSDLKQQAVGYPGKGEVPRS
jgi:predicted nucleic acid-binding protein